MFSISCCSLTVSSKLRRKTCAHLPIHYTVLSIFVLISQTSGHNEKINNTWRTSLLICRSGIGTILETFKDPPCSWQYHTTYCLVNNSYRSQFLDITKITKDSEIRFTAIYTHTGNTCPIESLFQLVRDVSLFFCPTVHLASLAGISILSI